MTQAIKVSTSSFWDAQRASCALPLAILARKIRSQKEEVETFIAGIKSSLRTEPLRRPR